MAMRRSSRVRQHCRSRTFFRRSAKNRGNGTCLPWPGRARSVQHDGAPVVSSPSVASSLRTSTQAVVDVRRNDLLVGRREGCLVFRDDVAVDRREIRRAHADLDRSVGVPDAEYEAGGVRSSIRSLGWRTTVRLMIQAVSTMAADTSRTGRLPRPPVIEFWRALAAAMMEAPGQRDVVSRRQAASVGSCGPARQSARVGGCCRS
jgi:hypothetical protein